ncbi:polyprenyl synthetase family protein [Spiribacter halobius]|uniref:Polyprenyl synthetase n=1 Tax=Sediminicurvatus halobius TaxID=2182432 RepID=A0A2U2N8G5_9GAMM|nr:polyprenyl synthetase family protein [Spiribacter halobius]PWG65481.1 polyprenyl synthetase [Spiribacter halobius]UEX76504.1 polyprenyl synthetase family protein [Spiribacter halobius]
MNVAVRESISARPAEDPDLAAIRAALENMVTGCPGHGLGQARQAAAGHLASGGQRLRARLCLDAAKGLGIPARQAIQLAVACELAHNASLVHDDICDRATERRGAPSVWAMHGTGGALCTGDWLLCRAFGALAEVIPAQRLPALLGLLSRRTADTVEGQIAELQAQGAAVCCTLSTYARLARAKSGPLFAFALEAPLTLAGHESLCRRARAAAHALALGYQLLDDLDDADTDAPEGVNAVRVLAAAGQSPAVARQRARALAHRRFRRALLLSAGLPEPVAAPLRACCRALAPAESESAEVA